MCATECVNVKDITARDYLFATTDDYLRDTLCTSTTAADMYERIINQHARTAADNRLILLQKFTEYKFQPGHNVTSPFTALLLLWSRLPDIGENILETQVMSKILFTLPQPIDIFTPRGTTHQKLDEL